MSAVQWLTSKIFPEAVETGSFGAHVKRFVSFKAKDDKGTDQFSSDVIFGDVTLETADGEQCIIPVVIKTTRSSMDSVVDSNVLFHNELLFYTKVLPLFRKHDRDNFVSNNICEFVYGRAAGAADGGPDENVIILRDLSEKGFKLSKSRLYLDKKHIELVLDRLGRYHALSLLSKADNPEEYNSVASQIKVIYFKGDSDQEIFKKTYLQGIEPLKTEPKYRDKLADLTTTVAGSVDMVVRICNDHSGPLSVIGHGDLSRNNLMFKYGEDGEPVDVVFFDFATIKYCSPAIDTSAFLSINVTAEDRQAHWDHFLHTYYGGILHEMEAHPKAPSFKNVVEDLRTYGVYGYFIASIFVPWMTSMIDGSVDFSPPEWDNLESDQLQEKVVGAIVEATAKAGPQAAQAVAQVARHMIDDGYNFNFNYNS